MEDGRAKAGNKAEIDTSAPFRSVREAVMLFGERVLAGEVYADKLKEMQDKTCESGLHGRPLASELEETKQSLQKAREESTHMARFLSALQQELEQTKRELEHLKIRASSDPETEDLKYVESSRESLVTEHVRTETPLDHQTIEFHKKKCVSFANHPSVLATDQVVVPSDGAALHRHTSLKKKKKKNKQLIQFITGIFSNKKESCDDSAME
ncbi:hypothetical protein OROHE_001345 [Orobanche hederae]